MIVQRGESMESLPGRIRAKIVINPETECWEWIAGKMEAGYGRVKLDGRMWLAHRAVYTLLVGSITPGLELDHLCFVKHCVNPAHLEQVTHRENSTRGIINRAHVPLTYCRKGGHAFTEENTIWSRCKGAADGWSRRCRTCTNAKWMEDYRAGRFTRSPGRKS